MKKEGIIISSILGIVILIVTLILNTSITKGFDSLENRIRLESNKSNYIYDGLYDDNMVARGDNLVATSPISASIEAGEFKLTATVNNNTNNTYKLRNFCTVYFGGYTYPAKVSVNDEEDLTGNGEITYTVTFNVSNIKNLNVVPTEANVYLGGNLPNGNYQEFELKYFISWKN